MDRWDRSVMADAPIGYYLGISGRSLWECMECEEWTLEWPSGAITDEITCMPFFREHWTIDCKNHAIYLVIPDPWRARERPQPTHR